MTKKLENLLESSKKKPYQIKNLYGSTLDLKLISDNKTRIFELISNKKDLRKLISFNFQTVFEDGETVIKLFDYYGQGFRESDFVNFLLKSSKHNLNIIIVLDDSYEGLLTNEDVEYFTSKVSENNFEIIFISSNYKLKGENVVHLNQHIFAKDFDNTIIQKYQLNPKQTLRHKKFVCLNRAERLHRFLTVDHLIKNDIIKHSYVSCQIGSFDKVLKENTNPFPNFSTRIFHYDEFNYKFDKDQRRRLLNNLPLNLPGENYLNPSELPDVSSFFNDAYWSIITERDFFRSDVYRGFSEKVLKSILYGNPFIIVGLPYTLEILKEHGFVTFSKYIDESYDKIEDDNKRMKAVLEQIDYLNSLDYIQHDLMYKNMKNILEYNHNHYQKLNNEIPVSIVNKIQEKCSYRP